MATPPVYEVIGPIPQYAGFVYRGQIVDDSATPVGIPASGLTSLTLTLTDVVSGSTINSRSAQNVLNTNQVTVDSSGNLAWSGVAADCPIVQTSPTLADGRVEVHQAIFEWSWNSGARQGKRKIFIQVEAYTKAPT